MLKTGILFCIILLCLSDCPVNHHAINKRFLKSYDTVSVFCIRCPLGTTKWQITKDPIDSIKSIYSLQHPNVIHYNYIDKDELIRSYFKLRTILTVNQNSVFYSLNNNMNLMNNNFLKIENDFRLIMLLKKKSQADTFTYLDKNCFMLNNRMYNTKTNLDKKLIENFDGIEDYCY